MMKIFIHRFNNVYSTLFFSQIKKWYLFCILPVFRMWDGKFVFLFCHILICITVLWNCRNRVMLLSFSSPIVWKVWFIFNILILFFISQLSLELLLLQILLVYTPVILTFFLQSFLIFIWKEQLYTQFEFFLNTLIAQIKMGESFRSAFKKAIESLSNIQFKNYFMEILETILFSKTLRKEFCFSPMEQMIQELKQADQSAQCLGYLENLRHQVRIRSIFRKKVQSALLQIRIQSLILLILYSGLFLFVLHKYGLKYIKVLFLSLLLFLGGFIILLQCGKKLKWTI